MCVGYWSLHSVEGSRIAGTALGGGGWGGIVGTVLCVGVRLWSLSLKGTEAAGVGWTFQTLQDNGMGLGGASLPLYGHEYPWSVCLSTAPP